MNESEWNELAGRIEACARMTLALAARMEDAGIIDGPQFSEQLRHSVQPGDASPEHLRNAQRVLREAADSLDAARARRLEMREESRCD